jgi:hypothetical protein
MKRIREGFREGSYSVHLRELAADEIVRQRLPRYAQMLGRLANQIRNTQRDIEADVSGHKPLPVSDDEYDWNACFSLSEVFALGLMLSCEQKKQSKDENVNKR